MYVQMVEAADGKWYVRVKGGNGEIVLTTQRYSTKSNAKRSAKRLAVKVEADRPIEQINEEVDLLSML